VKEEFASAKEGGAVTGCGNIKRNPRRVVLKGSDVGGHERSRDGNERDSKESQVENLTHRMQEK